MQDLTLLADSIFTQLSQIFTLFTTNFIFQFVFGLWLLRRIERLFRKIL